MAVPRPVIILVLGVALIAGVFLLMRGSANTSTVTPAPSVQAQAPATHPKPAPKPVTHAVTPPATAKPATPANPHAAAPVSAADAALQPVVRALDSGHTVVLFFSQSARQSTSSDDAATRAAVSSVASMRGVSVFTAGIDQLSTYRRLLRGVAVSQVPAVVVMRAGGKARLIEGFVDPGTLRQTIADELG